MRRSKKRKIVKIIAAERFDYHVFVQCECGEEIIDFFRITTEENGVEYCIGAHCNYRDKDDKYGMFTFYDKESFSEFVKQLKHFVDNEEQDAPLICYDKYLTYKNKDCGILYVGYTIKDDKNPGTFAIDKFVSGKKFDKGKRSSWEIVLAYDRAKELYEELENWH